MKHEGKDMVEYLRRNLLHCKAVGAEAGAGAEAVLTRLRRGKRPPKWLVKLVEGVVERARPVAEEMAKHRDEVSPYDKGARK